MIYLSLHLKEPENWLITTQEKQTQAAHFAFRTLNQKQVSDGDCPTIGIKRMDYSGEPAAQTLQFPPPTWLRVNQVMNRRLNEYACSVSKDSQMAGCNIRCFLFAFAERTCLCAASGTADISYEPGHLMVVTRTVEQPSQDALRTLSSEPHQVPPGTRRHEQQQSETAQRVSFTSTVLTTSLQTHTAQGRKEVVGGLQDQKGLFSLSKCPGFPILCGQAVTGASHVKPFCFHSTVREQWAPYLLLT